RRARIFARACSGVSARRNIGPEAFAKSSIAFICGSSATAIVIHLEVGVLIIHHKGPGRKTYLQTATAPQRHSGLVRAAITSARDGGVVRWSLRTLNSGSWPHWRLSDSAADPGTGRGRPRRSGPRARCRRRQRTGSGGYCAWLHARGTAL